MAGRNLFATDAEPLAGRNLFAPPPPLEPEQPSLPGAGIFEPVTTLATGAIAEPIAGLAGIAKMAFAPSPEEAVTRGARTVEETREALTFRPKTEEGQKSLETLGRALAPIGETLQSAERFLGDETFEATGSPALAAAATTVPTAIIEALGLASTKTFLQGAKKAKTLAKSKVMKRAIVESAPDVDELKNISRAVYRELDESGVMVKPEAYSGLVSQVELSLKEAKFKPRLAKNTDNVLKELKSELGKAQSLSDVDSLRQAAQGAISGIATPNDKRLIGVITDTIDNFLDEATPSNFTKGTISPSEILPKRKVAQELWGRARRSELISEAFEKAADAASGFENGIVIQLRGILRNKKQRRFFKPQEIEAMRTVVRGTSSANVAKLIGRFGFSEGHATNLLGGAVGTAAGAKLFGPLGAVGIPVIGQVSRKLAQRLTRRGAEFADAVIRAGDNADEIVRAYLAKTPKAQRKASELSELLSRPDIALDDLIETGNRFAQEAAETAKGRQIMQAVGAISAVAPSVAKQQIGE